MPYFILTHDLISHMLPVGKSDFPYLHLIIIWRCPLRNDKGNQCLVQTVDIKFIGS
jgi:hypothetical protein